jgi:hypothetical protein
MVWYLIHFDIIYPKITFALVAGLPQTDQYIFKIDRRTKGSMIRPYDFDRYRSTLIDKFHVSPTEF